MICLSHLLKSTDKYISAADRLFAALDLFNVKYKLLNNTKDIWLRDFMPVKTKSGKYVSFRYEPSYLANDSQLRTNFKTDIAPSFKVDNLVYTDINLDGGNVAFSPSKEKVIISDRVYSENPSWHKAELTAKHIFHKAIIPVNINEIAADGGLLNCISWET